MAASGEALPPPVAPANAAAANARPVGTLDPQLFMVACRGDNNRLRELLRLDNDEEGQSAGTVEPTVAAAAQEVVIVEVDALPAAAPSSSGAAAAASGSNHQLLEF